MGAASITLEGLTLDEEKCVQLFISSGEMNTSYAQVYGQGGRGKAWLNSESHKFFKKEHIKIRIQQLIKKTEIAALYAADDAMEEAKAAYDLARKLGQPSAMVAAVQLRARLCGHLIEKKEVTNRTIKEMAPEELEEEARKAAQQLGWTVESPSKTH